MTYSRLDLELPRELYTRRLRLRPVDSSDVDCHWQMDSDPQVMRYVQAPATDRQDHARAFHEGLAGDRFAFVRMIEVRDNPEPLGWVFLRPTEDGDWLELGYRLLPAAWGKGIVPEASSMLIDVAFDDWRAASVMALIVAENANSRRVAEKLGFENSGPTDRYYDERLDLWIRRA